jgi:hypothetical protein
MGTRRLHRVLGTTALAIPTLAAGTLSSTAVPVSAQTPGCESSGGTTICTFVSTGAEQSFRVPAGVTQLGVKLVGAPGGNGGKTGTLTPLGGKGATVNATLSGLTPGTTLYVEVGGIGGKGSDAGLGTVGPGGFNGGGSGAPGGFATSAGGGGGGGESDIRTCSASSCLQTLNSRLVIAAGGGAAGGTGSACCGSPAGGAGQDAATPQTTGGAGGAAGGGGGGVEGNKAGGGAGGGGGAGRFAGQAGSPGALQAGGAGGVGAGGGGGGGGAGLFGGGGGGGAGGLGSVASGGGGGGGCGSSSALPGGTVTPDTTGVPEVILKYSVGAPVPKPPTTGRAEVAALPLHLLGLLGLLLLCGASTVAWRSFENGRHIPDGER